ncbi:hypothetical protein FRC05_006591 [Tulasnella sp. 425]|nr:hypothetical protein FRC05_006591 [Tulasnella sp. 425]
MALDDPTLLVNVLTRDLRAMTNERDELLQKLERFQESSFSSSRPRANSRVQELESANGELQCQLLETETELKQARETAYSRLNENVELRNRRARVKRDLQSTTSKLLDAESTIREMEAKHEEAMKDMEKTLFATRDELASERRKNAGLKDLIARLTNQRDDALTKLSDPLRMSSLSPTRSPISPPRYNQQGYNLGRSTIDEFGRALPTSPIDTRQASIRKHAELSDALMTPLERNTFETIDMLIQSPQKTTPRREHPPSSPRLYSDDASMMDYDFSDFRSRSRRLNTLRKLTNIDVPEEAMAYRICNADDDLDAKLKVLAKSHIFNQPYFLGESDIEFANPTRQHGYILRPNLVLEPSHNRWSPYTLDTFEPDFPSIFELFVGSSKGWYYRGTYRRADQGGLDLGYLTAGEYSDLDSTTKSNLLEQTFCLSAETPSLPDPFASGEVLAQCIGLQCVGFNASLYHALDQPVLDGRSHSTMTYPMSDVTAVASRSNPTPCAVTPPPDRPKSGWDPISPEFGWQGGAKAFMKRLSNTWSGHKRIRSLDVGQADDDDTETLGKRIKLGRSNSKLRFTGH